MIVKNVILLILYFLFTFQVKASLPIPGEVKNLQAIKNNGVSVWQGSDMTFKWDAPDYSGTLNYTIELQEPGKNKWTWNSGWSSTEKVRPNMNLIGTYSFWVRACNAEAKCGSASLLNVNVVALKVTGLAAVKNNGSTVWQGSDMTFKWDKPNGYTKPITYTIELQEPNENKWTWSSDWSTTSKVRYKMNTIGTYNFWVKACNEYGSCGSASNLSVDVVSLSVTGLIAIKNNGGSVWQGSDMTFKWDKPNGYTKPLTYTIELQEPNENKWTWSSDWSTTSKVRSKMNTIGTYNFWVKACNEYGSCGSASNLSVDVVPLSVAGLIAIKNNGDSVLQGSDMTFKWDKPNGYTKPLTYTIELQEPNENKWTWSSDWSTTSKVRSNMNTIGTYNFWVKACNEYGTCGTASNLSVDVIKSTIGINVSFDNSQEAIVVSMDNPDGFTYELQETLLYNDEKRLVEQEWDVDGNDTFTLQRISGVYKYILKATNIINQADYETPEKYVTVGFGSKDLEIFSYKTDENLTNNGAGNYLQREIVVQEKYGGTVFFDGPSSFTAVSRTNKTCNNSTLSGSDCSKSAVYMQTIPEPSKDIDDRKIVIEFDFEVLDYDWTNWTDVNGNDTRDIPCLNKNGDVVTVDGVTVYTQANWLLFQDWNRLHGTTENNGGTIENNDFIDGNSPISSLEIVRRGEAGNYKIYLQQVQRAGLWELNAKEYSSKANCEREALYKKVVGEVLIGSQVGSDFDNVHIKIQINDPEVQAEGMKVWVDNNLISDAELSEYRTSAYKNGENKQDHSYMVGIYSSGCKPERCFNPKTTNPGENLAARISNLTFKGLY